MLTATHVPEFDWKPQPLAEAVVHDATGRVLAALRFAKGLADRLLAEAGVRFVDVIDTIYLPPGAALDEVPDLVVAVQHLVLHVLAPVLGAGGEHGAHRRPRELGQLAQLVGVELVVLRVAAAEEQHRGRHRGALLGRGGAVLEEPPERREPRARPHHDHRDGRFRWYSLDPDGPARTLDALDGLGLVPPAAGRAMRQGA